MHPRIMNSTVAMSMYGMSRIREFLWQGILQRTEVNPRISTIFIMLLPTTLPIVIPLDAVFRADVKETESSGADVPNATRVSPITSSGMCIFFARLAALSTNQSAPLTSIMNPAISNNMFVKNSMPLLYCK